MFKGMENGNYHRHCKGTGRRDGNRDTGSLANVALPYQSGKPRANHSYWFPDCGSFHLLIVVPIISIVLDAFKVQFGHEKRLRAEVGDFSPTIWTAFSSRRYRSICSGAPS